jgi:hypothetical protein
MSLEKKGDHKLSEEVEDDLPQKYISLLEVLIWASLPYYHQEMPVIILLECA